MKSWQGETHAKVITQAEYIFLISILSGFVVNFFWPIRIFTKIIHIPLGVLVLIPIIRMFVMSIEQFQKAHTPTSPYKPVKSLVMKGPYKRFRHPMYLSRAGLQVGIGLLFGNVWILIMLIPALVIIWYGVILPEEHYLEQRFGEKYLNYKKSTRLL